MTLAPEYSLRCSNRFAWLVRAIRERPRKDLSRRETRGPYFSPAGEWRREASSAAQGAGHNGSPRRVMGSHCQHQRLPGSHHDGPETQNITVEDYRKFTEIIGIGTLAYTLPPMQRRHVRVKA